jgi:hypothetical protein
MNYRGDGMHVLTANGLKPGVDPETPGKAIPPRLKRLKERIAEGRVVQAGKWGDIGGMVILKG